MDEALSNGCKWRFIASNHFGEIINHQTHKAIVLQVAWDSPAAAYSFFGPPITKPEFLVARATIAGARIADDAGFPAASVFDIELVLVKPVIEGACCKFIKPSF
jgi:hypothetical protein